MVKWQMIDFVCAIVDLKICITWIVENMKYVQWLGLGWCFGYLSEGTRRMRFGEVLEIQQCLVSFKVCWLFCIPLSSLIRHQWTYNVTMKRVRVIIVAVEKQ